MELRSGGTTTSSRSAILRRTKTLRDWVRSSFRSDSPGNTPTRKRGFTTTSRAITPQTAVVTSRPTRSASQAVVSRCMPTWTALLCVSLIRSASNWSRRCRRHRSPGRTVEALRILRRHSTTSSTGSLRRVSLTMAHVLRASSLMEQLCLWVRSRIGRWTRRHLERPSMASRGRTTTFTKLTRLRGALRSHASASGNRSVPCRHRCSQTGYRFSHS